MKKNCDEKTGPDALSALLTKSNAFLTAEEVWSLIPGVLSAPGIEDGMGDINAWMKMVANHPSPELSEHLTNILNKAKDFESKKNTFKSSTKKRFKLLREQLAKLNLDGFLVPVADEYQGEYVPKYARRLAWLTGFTGSAGVAVILKNSAALFVDGRYTLQAAGEVDKNIINIMDISKISLSTWITSQTTAGDALGYDPWLHTANSVRRLREATIKSGADLIAIEPNAIDIIWDNQPAKPLSPINIFREKFAGESATDKILNIRKLLKNDGHDAVVITSPASIAWLGNLRGSDVPYTPFTLAFSILHTDRRLEIFVDLHKVPPAIKLERKKDILFRPINDFTSALEGLGKKSAKVLIDPAITAEAVYLKLKSSGARLSFGDDPCVLPKSCKNNVELRGIQAAHRRDGLAITRFLAWLSRNSVGHGETELSAAERLESYRREGKYIQGLSFPTISGSGPNGAIIHYRVTEKSNQPLKLNSLYLVDSGGQYLDGTTDITRTIAIGKPTREMKERFTRVLSGNIALTNAVFPAGTTGSQLDVLARTSLWQAGLDYDHGTGHGVGHYLGVHEGPHGISKSPNQVPLKPGMIISNEPGYYKVGDYGIRIENLVVVTRVKGRGKTERQMLAFKTLTIAPIDLSLVEKSLLTDNEADWLNNYHSRVFETHKRSLNKQDREWLKRATKKI